MASDGLQWQNITASSSDSNPIYGDFGVYNIKSDIVEQVWRSGIPSDGKAWFLLDCGKSDTTSDTKAFLMDTLAILNHNFSPKAEISVWGYGGAGIGSSTRSVVKSLGTLLIDKVNPKFDNSDFVWVMSQAKYDSYAPGPLPQFRHWLIEISDPNNVDGYIQIGRFAAGSATIFTAEENLTANITYREISYKDEVKINGFTSISNARSLKKTLRSEFKNLNALSTLLGNPNTNYYNLKRYLRYCRDIFKALIIVDSRDPYLFYLYSKVADMPTEECNYLDDAALYVSMNIEWDEAR
jgi:hypothetical protein